MMAVRRDKSNPVYSGTPFVLEGDRVARSDEPISRMVT
jgi:hypothetical protein